jgi:hypothetical protein
MVTSDVVTESPVISKSTGQPSPEDKLVQKYTKKWTGVMGKSLAATKEAAKILFDAQVDFSELGTDPLNVTYSKWLYQTCRINESKASMYRTIHEMFRDHAELVGQYEDRLPVEYTKLYQVAKIFKFDGLIPEQAEGAFLDAIEYINTPKELGETNRVDGDTLDFVHASTKYANKKETPFKDFYPTTGEINTYVNGLLGKKKDPAKSTPTLGKPEAKLNSTESDVLESGTPDPLTGQMATNKAGAPLGELEARLAEAAASDPTPEEIAESVETDFATDDNEVVIAQFNQALDTIRITNSIRKLLNSEGLHGVVVTIAPKTKGASA